MISHSVDPSHFGVLAQVYGVSTDGWKKQALCYDEAQWRTAHETDLMVYLAQPGVECVYPPALLCGRSCLRDPWYGRHHASAFGGCGRNLEVSQ